MYIRLMVPIPREMFERLSSAARLSCQPVGTFAKEIIEADLATRTLATLPATISPGERSHREADTPVYQLRLPK